MATALTPEGACLAAAMMRGWGIPARVLVVIAETPPDEEQWHPVVAQAVADLLGVARRHVQRAIRRLEAAGVLDRLPGTGRRPNWYRVRGDVWRWRVPFGLPPEEVAAALSARGVIVTVIRSRAILPEADSVVAPSEWRDKAQTADSLSRHLNGATTSASRAFSSMGITPLSRHLNGATTGPAVFGPGEQLKTEEEEEGTGVEFDASTKLFVSRMTAVIYRRTKRPVANRAHLAELAALGQTGIPPERAEQALVEAAPGLKAPLLLKVLEHEVDLWRHELTASGPPIRISTPGQHSIVPLYTTGDRGQVVGERRYFDTLEEAEAAATEMRANPGPWLPDGATDPIVEVLG